MDRFIPEIEDTFKELATTFNQLAIDAVAIEEKQSSKSNNDRVNNLVGKDSRAPEGREIELVDQRPVDLITDRVDDELESAPNQLEFELKPLLSGLDRGNRDREPHQKRIIPDVVRFLGLALPSGLNMGIHLWIMEILAILVAQRGSVTLDGHQLLVATTRYVCLVILTISLIVTAYYDLFA